jgi:hypothetical protein
MAGFAYAQSKNDTLVRGRRRGRHKGSQQQACGQVVAG